MLLTLSNELLLCVAECLDSEQDISSFAQTSQCLQQLIEPYLYRHNTRYRDGSALSWAVRHNRCATAAKSIQSGADVNKETQQFGRPCRLVHLASILGFVDMLGMLVTVDAIDLNKRDDYGNTALHYAIRDCNFAMTKLLVESRGIQADATDGLGMTPLQHAANRGLTDPVKILLATSTVDVNHRDRRGRTALCYAAMAGSTGVARLLLRVRGVDAAAQDNDGQSAVSHAAANGHHEMVGLLLTGYKTVEEHTDRGRPTKEQTNSQSGIRPRNFMPVHIEKRLSNWVTRRAGGLRRSARVELNYAV